MRQTLAVVAIMLAVGLCGYGQNRKGDLWKVTRIHNTDGTDTLDMRLGASQIKGVNGEAELLVILFDYSPSKQTFQPYSGVSLLAPCSTGSGQQIVQVWITFDDAAPVKDYWRGGKGKVLVPFGSPTTSSIDFLQTGNLFPSLTFLKTLMRHQVLKIEVPCGPYDSAKLTFKIGGFSQAVIAAEKKH